MSRSSARRRPDDLLYEAVSEGRRYPGMEHWLPLFHDRLETLFDYLPGTPLATRAAGGRRRARALHADLRLLRGAARGAEGRRPRRPTSRCRRSGFISPKTEWNERLDGRRAGAGHALRGAGGARRRSISARAPGAISRPSAPSRAPMCSRRSASTSRRCRRPASASPSRCGARARASA